MNFEVSLLFEKRTDMLIEQTKTKPQETLELRTNKQMEYFLLNPSINLFEEGKKLIVVTSFQALTSVLIISIGNSSFLVTITGY